jgi:hypothetical protein
MRIARNCDLPTKIAKPVMQLWAVHSHKNTNKTGTALHTAKEEVFQYVNTGNVGILADEYR